MTVPQMRYTDGWKYILDAPITYTLSERWAGMPDVQTEEFSIVARVMTIQQAEISRR